jgi:hypothetical protein
LCEWLVIATESVFPVHLHASELVYDSIQALVAQVADGQRLGRVAERHQRDDLALVEYSVSGCSPAIAVGTISPRSL